MIVSDSLTIPSRITAIDEARRWATAHLAGASRDAVWAIEMVLTEALSNVMRHAYAGDEEQLVELTLEVCDEQVVLEIVDLGEPFDPRRYTPPDLDASPTGGYGVHLIGELMDEVDRAPAGDRGTRLRLVKRGWRDPK